jgi:hypothetical protein
MAKCDDRMVIVELHGNAQRKTASNDCYPVVVTSYVEVSSNNT